MYKEYFRKKVKVKLKNGQIFSGLFTDAFSQYDNDGPATIIIGSTEIEEQEVEKIELI